jgi:hypothetical protein
MIFDVLVAGATPAGCAAAIMAARAGHSVLLLEPTATPGGMNANGVHTFDSATPEALSGIAEEFAARVAAHYARSGRRDTLTDDGKGLYWEAGVAARLWEAWLAEHPSITLRTGAVPCAVEIEGGRIAAVLWRQAADAMGDLDPAAPGDLRREASRVVVDATYEGDIAAWSGAPWRLGREPRSDAEPHAGHIRTVPLALSPADGWPPHTILPGSTGEGDGRIMAFNIRLHLRFFEDAGPGAAHRIPPPPGYDPKAYKWDPSLVSRGRPTGPLTGVNRAVGGKFLLNRGRFGNDLVGPNRDFILARPEERRALRRRFVHHALGYLHFIQQNGTPELGLATDEFPLNSHIPYRIYAREGRRIEGLAQLTERDLHPWLHGIAPRPPLQPDSVAIGDWPIEAKHVRDDADEGYTYPEGALFLRLARAPFQVPLGCLVPRGVENLIVACALSATHVAYSAMRCEALWLATGTAAGALAALALAEGGMVPRVPAARVQEALLAVRGKTTYLADLPGTHPHFAAVQWAALRGLVPHDAGFRAFPDVAASWGDLAEATVRCLGLPISVTGAHVEGIDPTHPAFRFIETLYDLGSRAGEEVYPHTHEPIADPQTEHYRPEPRGRWLRFRADDLPGSARAASVLAAVARAAGLTPPPPLPEPLTRGALLSALRQMA